MSEYKSEIRDGMRIDWDVPVRMDDGIVLRADVFRPVNPGRYPALGPHHQDIVIAPFEFSDRFIPGLDRVRAFFFQTVLGSTEQSGDFALIFRRIVLSFKFLVKRDGVFDRILAFREVHHSPFEV